MRGFAISGRAGSGKTTLAGHLVDRLEEQGFRAKRVSFGTALKIEVAVAFGLTKDDPGGREKLVSFGEKERAGDPLRWVRPFAAEASLCFEYGWIVVCDDLRFLSELGWCHMSGLETVRLEVPADVAAKRIPQAPDPSSPGERELEDWSGWHHRFDDPCGTLDLKAVARRLVNTDRPAVRV